MIFVVKGGALPAMVCVPGVSGSKCAIQPCPTDRPVVPAGRPKMLSAGRTMFIGGVSASFTGTLWPSTVTEGAVCASFCSAQARNSASVVPFPSSVLHSSEDAATKILVPGFTVHDGTPLGPNGATVPPPRFQHVNASPPEPNAFWADGVSSTVVHNAVRLASIFTGAGAALAAGAAARAAQAANRPTASPRKPGTRIMT